MSPVQSTLIRALLIAAAPLASLAIVNLSSAATVELNPEVEQMERSLEGKVLEHLKIYLGEAVKVIANVHVREAPVKRTQAPAQATGLDVVYAPFDYVDERSMAPDVQTRQKTVIDSVEVDIQIAGEFDAPALAKAKDLILKSFAGLNPTVTVSNLSLPQTVADTARNQDPLERFKHLFPSIAVLLSAFLLAIGIFFIAHALRSGAKTVVEGLASVFNIKSKIDNVGLTGVEDKPIVLEHKNSPNMTPQKPVGTATPAGTKRNIGLVKKVLLESPMLFLQATGESDADLHGLRWLLPHLTADEQDSLKNFFGESRISKLSELDPSSPAASADQTLWLQEFVERLMLKKIQTQGLVERALGPEMAAQFFIAKPEQLVDAARKVNSPAAWRIANEFLPKERLEKLLTSLQPGEWINVIQSGRLDVTTVKNAADQIASELNQGPKTDAVSDDTNRYFSRTLLDPIVRSLESQEFGQDEVILEQVATQAPELLALVHERFWTPKTLARIPDAVLVDLLKRLRNEQRVEFLLALPSPHSDRLEALLPQGNIRTIVQDQLTRARSQNNPTARKSATASARQIIEHLRKRHQAGEFELLNDGGAEPASQTAELQKAA